MTNDLKEKSKEIIELGKSFMRQHYNVPLPEFVQHIQALQKRLDDYEERKRSLIDTKDKAREDYHEHLSNGLYDRWRVLVEACAIMTEGE